MYVSVGSKLVLNWNISTRYKLVNGSTGIVKDIVFSEGESPPENLPLMIVMEYPLTAHHFLTML